MKAIEATEATEKVQQAFEGLTSEEKAVVLYASLEPEEALMIASWILGNSARSIGASKAVVKANKETVTLNFVAGKGQSLQLKGEE